MTYTTEDMRDAEWDYDFEPDEEIEMTTTDQDRTIQRIAEEYDRVTVRQNAGPNQDRAVIVCPDGRAVVLDGDGEIIADSHKKQRTTRPPSSGWAAP